MRSVFATVAGLLSLCASASVSAQGNGVIQPTDGTHVMGIQHVAMTVGDIDATMAFYKQAVPVTVLRRFQVSGTRFPRSMMSRRHARVDIAILSFPTGIVQLMDFEPGANTLPNPQPVIGPGYSHICFQSSSADPAIKRFMAAGLNVISRFGKADGVDIGGYGVRYAYGTDINGIMIENESLDVPKRAEPAWITHIANAVHDRDRMLTFYTAVTGRKAHRTIEQENRPRLDDVANIDGLKIRGGWINVGNMDIEVWEYVHPRTPAPTRDRKIDEIGYSQLAFQVADLQAETKRLRRSGVRLVGQPRQIGGWLLQYGYDPEGNVFALTTTQTAPANESVVALR